MNVEGFADCVESAGAAYLKRIEESQEQFAEEIRNALREFLGHQLADDIVAVKERARD